MTHEFNVGDKAIAVKLGWTGDGTDKYPLKRCDVKGVITSVKGMPKHISVYKYEFTYDGNGRFYTDNLNNELLPY